MLGAGLLFVSYVFPCFGFTCSKQLTGGLTIQMDSKPYNCTICGKSFICVNDGPILAEEIALTYDLKPRLKSWTEDLK